MPNWGVNPKQLLNTRNHLLRKQEAREREEAKKDQKKAVEKKKKEESEWVITDKAELAAIERRKQQEEKARAEQERKLENKKLYEEDMAQYKSNKKGEAGGRLTRAQVESNKQKLLLATLAKSMKVQGASSGDEEEEEKHSFDDDEADTKYTYKLKPNLNHIMREQAAEDEENYDEVLKATGIDEALDKMDISTEKHPEKRAKAVFFLLFSKSQAFERYVEQQMPEMKVEYPGLKRSQYMEIIFKNWKKAPENPFNKSHLEYNEKA